MNWTTLEDTGVKAIHHSTSSVIEVIVPQDDGKEIIDERIFFDYCQWEALRRIFEKEKSI